MNRALLNPFEALKLPDNLELYLETDSGKATCMAFNRHGNVLAVGLSTGHIALWDFDTRSSDNAPVYFVGGQTPCDNRVPDGHHVTTVAFPAPRIGEQILASFAAASSCPPPTNSTGSMTKHAIVGRNGVVQSEYGTGVIRLCNTLDGRVISEIDFDMPIMHFVPHPTQANVLVVLPANMYPLLVTIAPGRCSIRRDSVYTAPVGPDIVHSFPTEPMPMPMPAKSTATSNGPPSIASAGRSYMTVSVLHVQHVGNSAEQTLVLPIQSSGSGTGRRLTRAVLDPYVVAFSRNGRRMVRGGPDGIVHVFEFPTVLFGAGAGQVLPSAKLVNWFKVAGGASIRSLTLTKAKLLVNSADRSLRLFDANSIVPSTVELSNTDGSPPAAPTAKTTFTEAVNRSQAKCACFSRDGDFVLAGMQSTDSHRIVVWRASDGHPETTLEGPGEGLLDLLWHPVQPVIASIGAQYGGVYVWAKNFTENWSAFAPQFTELEANEEYSENEGEFDAKHPSSDERVKLEREAEEERIIVNVEAPFCFSSDEEIASEGANGNRAKRLSKHKRFFSLPAIPEPDTYFAYETADKNGKKARDVVKKGRNPKRQRVRCAEEPTPSYAAPSAPGGKVSANEEMPLESGSSKQKSPATAPDDSLKVSVEIAREGQTAEFVGPVAIAGDQEHASAQPRTQPPAPDTRIEPEQHPNH